jgi:hypothetical protein
LLLITAGLAFISVLGLGASLEHDLKRRSLYGHLGALILPVSANAFVAFLAWSRPEFLAGSPVPRIVAIPFGLVAVGSLVTAGVIYVRAQGKAAERIARQIEENEQQQALNQADAIERDATHRAELDELADDTPLTTFVTHLFIDKSEAHHRLALARIGGLPDLAARFDAELRANPDPLAREYLLNYFEMAEPVDPGVLDALRPTIAWCFEQLAGDFEQALAQGRTEEVRHVGGMPMGLLLAARKFGQPRFVGGAARLRAVLKAWPESAGAEAVRALDDYLAEPTVG